MSLPTEQLINELQSFGVRLADPKAGVESRRGGAGPSDLKALTIDGVTVMALVHTAPAFDSPYVIEKPGASGGSRILRDGLAVAEVRFPQRPRFYDLKTEEASRILTLRRCMAATSSQPPSCRLVSAIKAAQRPASSAPSASRLRQAEPSSARRPLNLSKSRARRSNSTALSTW
jgi:hypothetical protein